MGSVSRSPGGSWRCVSLLFYRAVRDLKPVWMLEDMRTMETLYPEEEDAASRRTYSPSEALLYAIVHDHQPYARYLLGRYTEEALARPGDSFCCCPASSSPHLAMAVRYDRRYILGLILQEAHSRTPAPPAPPAPDSLLRPAEDGRTPLHVACELLRPEAAALLLGSGACPLARDRDGNTPLDVLLEKLRDCAGGDGRRRRQCLDNLLMFTPRLGRFNMRAELQRDPQRWVPVLGEDIYRYLSGRSPAPLLLTAMRTVLQRLGTHSLPESIRLLPIPESLKPPGLTGDSMPGDRHGET